MGEERTIDKIFKVAQKFKPDNEYVFPVGIDSFDSAMDKGLRNGELVVVSGTTGSGKCLGKGTLVLMYNGKVKKVEEVKVGDLLMGDDSKPRKVLSLARGKEKMYRVIPKKGESYVVNKSHILSLKRTRTNKWRDDNFKKEKRSRKNRKGEVVDIAIKDYLKKSKTFKHIYKGYRTGVEFSKKEIPLDPYFIGLWLGDGTSADVGITTMDEEIVEYLKALSRKMNLGVKTTNCKNNKANIYRLTREKKFKSINKCGKYIYENKKTKKGGYGRVKSLKSYLRGLNLLENKHIPLVYKTNNRKNRLKLLAGLIDSDGYLQGQCYGFVNKNKKLTDDVVFLARSLGFAAYSSSFTNKQYRKKYWRVTISGDLSIVPVLLERKKCKKRKQKKDVLVTGIKVKLIGTDDYYGFTISGNGRFLLGDFTVTHNTTFCQNLTLNLHNLGVPSLWFTYEQDPWYLKENFVELGAKEDLLAYAPVDLVSNEIKFIEQELREAVEEKACRVIFIDHLHYLIPLKATMNTSMMIGGVVRELKRMAVRNKVVIFLIAHTRKINAGEELNLSSIRDSGLVATEADYVFLTERKKKKRTVRDVMEGPYASMGDAYLNESRVTLAKNRRTGRILYQDFTVKKGRFIEITKNYDDEDISKKY